MDHDVVLVHDPELVLAAAGGPWTTNLIWDVHEDPAAALQVKSWMPAILRRPVATQQLAPRREAGGTQALPDVGRIRLSSRGSARRIPW